MKIKLWVLVELMILSHVSQFKLFIELIDGRSRNQSPTNCKPNGDFAATSAIVMNDDCGEVQSGCCDENISK